MVLAVSASGEVLNVVLIFKGEGKRLKGDELRVYSNLRNVIVLWQKKAWIDATGELAVMKRMIKGSGQRRTWLQSRIPTDGRSRAWPRRRVRASSPYQITI
jgi:hypothetical protein